MQLQVEPSHPTTDFVFCANAMKVLTNNQKPTRKKKKTNASLGRTKNTLPGGGGVGAGCAKEEICIEMLVTGYAQTRNICLRIFGKETVALLSS